MSCVYKHGWKSLGFSSYQEFLSSPFWLEKKEWILDCLGNECQKCSSKEKLQVHHKSYLNVGNEGIKDVIVLCKKCHEEEHNDSSR